MLDPTDQMPVSLSPNFGAVLDGVSLQGVTYNLENRLRGTGYLDRSITNQHEQGVKRGLSQ